MTPLFLYGTLRHGPLRATLAGGPPLSAEPAVGQGWRVDRQKDSELPMLVADPEAAADGILIRKLTPDQALRLDAYELPFGYALAPLTVLVGEEAVDARAYLPPPGAQSSGEVWSLERWQARAAAQSLLAAQELAAHDPALQGAEMLRQWPMVQARATARLRAAASAAPATVRYRPDADDWQLTAARPLTGAFFKLAGMLVRHRRFDGGQSVGLPREVLLGADAALVLPYDPARNRVLLVEQFRPAPARRGDPNPWALEPVAGIVDGGETPEQAARREAMEEAHLELRELTRMFSIYASPGSTTDHFHCYLGLCDLPDAHPRQGGLVEEHEDLRLHLLPFDEALDLIDRGEANVGPLVAMLLWLDRYRRRNPA